MKPLFWASLALILYSQIGYPAFLFILARFRPRHALEGAEQPSVSVIVATRNVVDLLRQKLENLLNLSYPRELVEIIVVSDGSTDGTNALLHEMQATVKSIVLDQPRGKAVALNEGVRRATGEILVFFDTRQVVERDAVSALCRCFVDPEVGAVSGELLLEDVEGNARQGLGVYWRIEKLVRRLESSTGSVVGVTGAIYAMRRELFVGLPEGTILDDVLIPMNVARQGKRVIFQPAAMAHDRIFNEPGKEFARKVRTLTGNYQLLQLAPWLITASNPLFFRFVSHKLMRLALPVFLLVLIVSAACAQGEFYRVALVGQLLFYGLAALGWLSPPARKFRPVAIAETFTMLNVAALVALYDFATGRRKVWI